MSGITRQLSDTELIVAEQALLNLAYRDEIRVYRHGTDVTSSLLGQSDRVNHGFDELHGRPVPKPAPSPVPTVRPTVLADNKTAKKHPPRKPHLTKKIKDNIIPPPVV